MKTIANIVDEYKAKGYLDDGNGLIGIKSKNGYDWYRYDEKSKRYVMTGSTRTRGKNATYHLFNNENLRKPRFAMVCEHCGGKNVKGDAYAA